MISHSLQERQYFNLEISIQLLTKHTSKSQAMLKDKWQHCSETILKRSAFWSCCKVNMYIAPCSEKKLLCSLWFTVINIWKLNKLNSYQKWEKMWDKYQMYNSCSFSTGTSRTPCKHAPCCTQWKHCKALGTFSTGTTKACVLWSALVQPWPQEHTQLKSHVCTPAMPNSPEKIHHTIKNFLHGSRL